MLYERNDFRDFMLRNIPTSEYHLDLEIISNPPKEYIESFFEQLKAHSLYESIKDNFIYDSELNIFAHIHNRYPFSEIEDLSQEEVFFFPFMDKSEIRQIFNIKSSEDYLLRLRAEQVESDMRLKRTFSKLKKKFGKNYSFTNHFEANQYKSYLKNLTPQYRQASLHVPHGTIHSNDANGMCLNTPFGNIIVLSYALRHFLFYINLFHFGSQLGLKSIDKLQSFILAIRIMIGTESFDFELDPRAKLPRSIKKKIDYMTDWQTLFIIGHEYAHHYLGHLENKSILNSHNRVRFITEPIKFYTYNQECEFDADRNAINNTIYNNYEKTELIDGAFLFFSFLDMYDKIEDYLFPKMNYSKTHPEPIDRIWHLRDSIDESVGLKKQELRTIIDYNNSFVKEFLQEYLPYNVETIETVGSTYITSYKKKYLVDRLDF